MHHIIGGRFLFCSNKFWANDVHDVWQNIELEVLEKKAPLELLKSERVKFCDIFRDDVISLHLCPLFDEGGGSISHDTWHMTHDTLPWPHYKSLPKIPDAWHITIWPHYKLPGTTTPQKNARRFRKIDSACIKICVDCTETWVKVPEPPVLHPVLSRRTCRMIRRKPNDWSSQG